MSYAEAAATEIAMNSEQFTKSVTDKTPKSRLSAPLKSLWWDAKGDWAKAHALVDELETKEGMAVHAYLHRKEGSAWNADYWYQRSSDYRQTTLEAEWKALVEAFLSETENR